VTDLPSTNADARRGLFGLALVAVGVLMLLGQLELIPQLHLWQYFAPAVLIVLGVGRMLAPTRAGGRGRGGLLLVAIGVWLLLGNLHVWSLRHSWPLVLIAVGLGIVWKAVGRQGRIEGVRQ
jgi:hypothetical protein